MAKTYNTLTIEVKEDITDIITAKQDDTQSRYLDVILQDDGQPINLTGQEVRIYGRKKTKQNFSMMEQLQMQQKEDVNLNSQIRHLL